MTTFGINSTAMVSTLIKTIRFIMESLCFDTAYEMLAIRSLRQMSPRVNMSPESN